LAKQDSVEEKLITSFNEQFATNQNHAQVIFIQFLTAILAVLIGYGYVYANTNASAFLFGAYKEADKLISFSIVHLFGAFIIAELILTMLATVILNTGYSFRRDQLVIYRIRLKYLKDGYEDIFGKASFNPKNKTLSDFLPEFTRSFFIGIAILQILLLISFLYAIRQFICYPPFNCFWTLISNLLFFGPLLWTIFVYLNSFKKYYWIMTDTKDCWLPRYRQYHKMCKELEKVIQSNEG
jgi:hypothetical protein